MDCYELVVKGLQNLGVRYRGKGGLGERLMQEALGSGLARNRYLNGEGIVRTSGDKVFEKTILDVRNPGREARRLMGELNPLLRQGQILSFSMRTRGHTGVVSQRNGSWTFINSGTLDNPVSRTRVSKGVGEEDLEAELRNWLRLAGERREGLRIQVGSLDRERLSAFVRPGAGGGDRA
jgi:hypothetical protein